MDVKALKQRASRSLQLAGKPRGLTLLHCLVLCILEIVLVAITYMLEKGIASTGGLSGMGTRSILTTAQMFLQVLVLVLTPFWQMGIVRAYLSWNRREDFSAGGLLSGFRRFGPVLGWNLLKILLVAVVCFLCAQIASVLYSVTPQGMALMEQLEPYMTGTMDYSAILEEIPMEELLTMMKPVMMVFAVLAIPVGFFVFFMVRLGKFVVMDDEPIRPLRAALRSIKLLRKNMGVMLRLDLSFWWYYLAQALLLLLGYGDVLLLKLSTRADASLLFYGFFALQIVAKLLVAGALQAKVGVTYAAFYEELKKRLAEREAQKEEIV